MRTVASAFESWIPTPASAGGALVFLTCDHASARMPAPLRWPREDLHLVGTHWSYDLGAAALAHALRQHLQAPLVCSRFSRLVVDPNRRPTQPSFIVPTVGEQTLALNAELDPSQRQWRQTALYEAYHGAIDDALGKYVTHRGLPLLLSIHTFTPLYQGQRRTMDGGILFDAHEELARRFCRRLREEGWAFEENAPYSGYDGLIDGIARHGKAHNCPYLEIELRQDLASCPVTRDKFARCVAQACKAVT